MDLELTDTISREDFVNTDVGLIPRDWCIRTLDDVAQVIDPHPSHRAPAEVKQGIPFLGIGDFDENGNIVKNTYRIVDESIYEEHQPRYNLNDNLIGLGRVASIGKVVRLRNDLGKYTISPTLGVIKPLEIDPDFLFFILKSSYITNYFKKIMSGSTRSSVGMIVLRKIPIPMPSSIPEQERIAESLKAINDKINELNKTVEKYELIREGMMQELLTGKTRLV